MSSKEINSAFVFQFWQFWRFHVFSLKLCGVTQRRRYPPSLYRATSVTLCPCCFSLSNRTSHVFLNYSLSGQRNQCWRCTHYSSVYSEHFTKFICIVDSISMRHMVLTLSVKFITVNLFTRTLACAYSIIYRIHQTGLSSVYDFQKIWVTFYIGTWTL